MTSTPPEPPLCLDCKGAKPLRDDGPDLGTDLEDSWSTRKYLKRSLSSFIEYRHLHCRGCSCILDALEALEPGWAKRHASDAVVDVRWNRAIIAVEVYLRPDYFDPVKQFELYPADGKSWPAAPSNL